MNVRLGGRVEPGHDGRGESGRGRPKGAGTGSQPQGAIYSALKSRPLTRLAGASLRSTRRADLSPAGRGEPRQ